MLLEVRPASSVSAENFPLRRRQEGSFGSAYQGYGGANIKKALIFA
jgi:hypothetical protein